MDDDEITMNPTDHTALDMLTDGRVTPSFVAERHGCSRQNANSRLNRLVELGYVRRAHRGLYELVKDPRESTSDKTSGQT